MPRVKMGITHLGMTEWDNLNHWTVGNVLKPNNINCTTMSQESLRNDSLTINLAWIIDPFSECFGQRNSGWQIKGLEYTRPKLKRWILSVSPSSSIIWKVKLKLFLPIQAWTFTYNLLEVEAYRISRQHMKVASLSALCTDCLITRRYPWYSLLLEAESIAEI